jgi:hypothetical protein
MSERIATERWASSASSLVRRLVQAQCDPVKRRVRQWLAAIGEQGLSDFGLTADDIAVLRGEPAQIGADHRPVEDQVASSAAERERAAAAHRSTGARRLSLHTNRPLRTVLRSADGTDPWFQL